MSAPGAPFGAAHAVGYDQRIAPLGPIFAALHHLIAARLAGLQGDAHVLCVGVGTGAEVLALAARYPGWRFTGVDPSGPMLERCRAKVDEAGLADRVSLVQGTTEDLPDVVGFDAATAILVSQFLTDRALRVSFFAAIARRLRAGGVLASVDLSAPDVGAEAMLGQWFALQGAVDSPAQRATFAAGVAALPAAQVEAIIATGGFAPPVQFFQALMVRGWFALRR